MNLEEQQKTEKKEQKNKNDDQTASKEKLEKNIT